MMLVAPQASTPSIGCFSTPQQTEGPFYPLKFPKDSDRDLTVVQGHRQSAWGEKIIIAGKGCHPRLSADWRRNHRKFGKPARQGDITTTTMAIPLP